MPSSSLRTNKKLSVKAALPNTEERILEAARQVFLQKGFDGARTQEIADAAGINKALLHYYFRNKQLLFERVFADAFTKLLPTLAATAQSQDTIPGKIASFVTAYLQAITEHPYIPLFVLSEIHRNPDSFFKRFLKPELSESVTAMLMQLKEAADAGVIRPVDPRQLIMNIMSLCVFPFVARPMMQKVMKLNHKQFDQLMQERRQAIITFITNAIMP